MHGVKEITNGKRFTIPMFFTVENKKNNSYWDNMIKFINVTNRP
jgi:hypothetical protein